MATENERQNEHGGFDREIRFRGALATGLGILALTVLAMLLMWPFAGYLRDAVEARDEPLTAVQTQLREDIVRANEERRLREVRVLPTLGWPLEVEVMPEPRLQVAPQVDMEHLRAEEAQMLGDYGWSDREAGLVRVPVERAIEQIVEGGLPEFPPPPEPEEEITVDVEGLQGGRG